MKELEELKNKKVKKLNQVKETTDLIEWLLTFSFIFFFLAIINYGNFTGFYVFPVHFVGPSPLFAFFLIIVMYLIFIKLK